ncbi:MAG: GreA/GreB family elongation factor [Candidatus Dojkabacteria bacterium]|nr:MAG: GreA/GreB family elongation factor [Candidatus Dojkabacteria bacterium]
MNEKVQLTQKGYEKLKKDLQKLTVKRDELKGIVEEMRARGDVSENEGYTLSLEQYQVNEKRIADIQVILDTADIVNDSKGGDSGVVELGAEVEVDVDGSKVVYFIVGESESDPLNNKITLKSPIGMAIAGKKAGAKVVVELPRKKLEYKILSVK